MRKADINQLASRINDVVTKVDIIMRNRLVLAILLLVNGINFILKPNNSVDGMTKGAAIFVLMASFTLLSTNAVSKKRGVKTIVLSSVTMVVCVIIYIIPSAISFYLKIILALIIIFDALINVSDSFNLNSLSVFIADKKAAVKNVIPRRELNRDFDEGINRQTEKITSPISNMIGKT